MGHPNRGHMQLHAWGMCSTSTLAHTCSILAPASGCQWVLCTSKLGLLLSNRVAKKDKLVACFDHKGLCQSQK